MTKNIFNNPLLDTLRALDDSPIMRAIRAIEDSPAKRMMRELENSPTMQAVRQLEKSPAIRIMRDIENSPALKIIKAFEESSDFKAIRQLQYFPALRAIRALEFSPSIEAFSKVADQLDHNYGARMFSEACELLIDEYDELSTIEQLDSLASLSEKAQDRASHSPFSHLSAEFYLNLIFALLFFYLSQMSATESEERILKRMNALEQTISEQLGILHKNEADHIFLVTDRSLNLRRGPSVDDEVIEILPKDKKVKELERKRDWIKIEYFDYINNKNKIGWVHSRYLLIVDSGDEE